MTVPAVRRGSRLAPSTGMTTSTTKDHPPDTQADAAIEPLIARKTEPWLTIPQATSEDLESRIKLRRAELIEKLGELRADTRLAATEVRGKLKASLSELAHIIKMELADGWASPGDAVKHNLEDWLAESEHSLSIQELRGRAR